MKTWKRGLPQRFYELGSESLTVQELASRAGCPVETMRDRLRRHTPARALAMGASGSTVGSSNFAISLNAQRVKKQGESKPVQSIPIWDRFKVNPTEVKPFFSALKPGQYPVSSGTAVERHCGGES